MPPGSIDALKHPHLFLGASHARNERRTWIVVGLTALMMVIEIVAGAIFGSMALLADGFHMATHAGALGIAALAYFYARKHAGNERFTFGTGKLGELAGYSSAVILAVIALLIGFESLVRLTAPVAIRFDEAIAVAVLGLIVNLASAWLLHDSEHHHEHDGHHSHEDHNLRSAYFHVLADALTSVLAIAGLMAGRVYGWLWVDPLVGIVGAIVIARWAWGLLEGAGAVLLDTVPDQRLAAEIRRTLERDGDQIADLHLWRIGPGHMALIASVVTSKSRAPSYYKEKLARFPQLSHVTVEVHSVEAARQAA